MVKAINNQQCGWLEYCQDELVLLGVNYDLWMGLVLVCFFNWNRFYIGWYWFWDYGMGDLGNDGVYQVDFGCWVLNLGVFKVVSCSGAKFGWKGDVYEVFDVMVVIWEYEDLLYVFEQCDFIFYWMFVHELDNDNIFYGDVGYMMVDCDGYCVFYCWGKLGVLYYKKWIDDGVYYQNFVFCVKNW